MNFALDSAYEKDSQLVPTTSDQDQSPKLTIKNENQSQYGNEFDIDMLNRYENGAQIFADESTQHLHDPNQIDSDELNAILHSIQSGRMITHKKLQYQALCAAISHEDQVRFVMEYLSKINTDKNTIKVATAKSKIYAFRVTQMDPVQQKEVLAEGFDDDGEDGAGEKLLTAIQKMDIGNIMVVVCVWNNGVSIGDQNLQGGEFFRIISERVRELLQGIKADVVKVSPNVQSEAKLSYKSQTAGEQVNQEKVDQSIDDQILSMFKQSISQQDLIDSKKEIDDSIEAISKASLMELRAISKPHQMIEKTLQIVCSLRGFKQLNWNTAKELLGRPSLKVELISTAPKTMKAADVLRAQQILTQKTNFMLTPENVQLHSEAAALLLIWAANSIKQYACFKKLQRSGQDGQDIDQKQVFKIDNFPAITTSTKLKLKLQMDANASQKKLDIKKAQSPDKSSRQQAVSNQYGSFLPAKKIIFNENEDLIQPKLVNEVKQKVQEVVDLRVHKKGLNYHGYDAKKQKKEHEEIEAAMIQHQRQEELKAKQSKIYAQPENQTSTHEDGNSKPAEVNDLLKMAEVQNLPDDVDAIIGNLKTVDFGVQNLDVLIELSKQLKYKRLGLFPDSNYMVSLQEAGLTLEQVMKQKY